MSPPQPIERSGSGTTTSSDEQPSSDHSQGGLGRPDSQMGGSNNEEQDTQDAPRPQKRRQPDLDQEPGAELLEGTNGNNQTRVGKRARITDTEQARATPSKGSKGKGRATRKAASKKQKS